MADETPDAPTRTILDDLADEFVLEFTPGQHRHDGSVPVSLEIRKSDLRAHAKRLLHRFMDYVHGAPMTEDERARLLDELAPRLDAAEGDGEDEPSTTPKRRTKPRRS